jgi:flagellar basal-body rod modification protein FlgD
LANTIDSSLLLSNYQANKKSTGSSALGKDEFLKILMVQLQNQDPTSPMEDREFIAQMAQFSTLEQMTNLNSTMQKMIESQEQSTLISYSQFLGKEVNWHKINYSEEDPNAEPVIEEGTGIVKSIQFIDGGVKLILEDGIELEPGNISGISEATTKESESSLAQASTMIGANVSYMNDANEELASQISSVSTKNGKTYYQLNDGEATSISSSQITKIQ